MDAPLDLDPLVSRLPLDRPFTRGAAYAAGIQRRSLDRMLATGSVRRLLRGVYAVSTATDSTPFRAAAAGLATAHDSIVVDRTAGWVHGLELSLVAPAYDVVPLDVVSPSGRGPRARRQLAARDVGALAGVCVTTPLRTALDLGRSLAPGPALGTLDAFLSRGAFSHTALLAELPRLAAQRGVGQLRRLAVQADARSRGLAESVLRLHWNDAALPTAVPGMLVVAGGRVVRLALALEQRQFGAVLAGDVTADDLVALEGAGWRVVVLARQRVLGAEPEGWVRHLEREFHQQLLAQTG